MCLQNKHYYYYFLSNYWVRLGPDTILKLYWSCILLLIPIIETSCTISFAEASCVSLQDKNGCPCFIFKYRWFIFRRAPTPITVLLQVTLYFILSDFQVSSTPGKTIKKLFKMIFSPIIESSWVQTQYWNWLLKQCTMIDTDYWDQFYDFVCRGCLLVITRQEWLSMFYLQVYMFDL